MAEAALVLPMVVALLFGIIEWGYAMYDKQTSTNMSVSGARAASGYANDLQADYQVLQAVKQASSAMQTAKITTVIVYRATAPSDRVPDACKSGSVTNTTTTRGCNRYAGTDLALASDQFGCTGPPGPTQKIDRFWCPNTRRAAASGANAADYIGVYVEVFHQNATGLFGPSYTFITDTVYRIEPRTRT
jgi:hypothetical protein